MNIRGFIKRWMAAHAEEIGRAVKEANPEHRGPFWVGMVECWHCGKSHAMVVPMMPSETKPGVAIECPKCNLFTAYPSEEGRIEPGT